MGIRESLNRRPWHFSVVAAAIIAALVFWFRPSGSSESNKAWFSVDDGKTFFADDASNLPPFDHQGKPAVQCFIYRIGKGEPWVAYLMRLTPEGKQVQEKQMRGERLAAEEREKRSHNIEVKRPGTGDWVKMDDPRAMAIVEVRPPEGLKGNIEPLDPNLPSVSR
jgi:hypothetical protein